MRAGPGLPRDVETPGCVLAQFATAFQPRQEFIAVHDWLLGGGSNYADPSLGNRHLHEGSSARMQKRQGPPVGIGSWPRSKVPTRSKWNSNVVNLALLEGSPKPHTEARRFQRKPALCVWMNFVFIAPNLTKRGCRIFPITKKRMRNGLGKSVISGILLQCRCRRAAVVLPPFCGKMATNCQLGRVKTFFWQFAFFVAIESFVLRQASRQGKQPQKHSRFLVSPPKMEKLCSKRVG